MTRLQAFFENLSNFDREMFENQNNDLTYLEGKKATNNVSLCKSNLKQCFPNHFPVLFRI